MHIFQAATMHSIFGSGGFMKQNKKPVNPEILSKQKLVNHNILSKAQMRRKAKTMYYIHKDHLGSYETITNNRGELVEKLSFDPWGRRRNADTWTFANVPEETLFDRGYTGHEHLDAFGFVNMNGRVYDPWVGSFLSPDPILQSPSNSQNYNRYSYALNNPLKFIDPSGYANERSYAQQRFDEYNSTTHNPYLASVQSNSAHSIGAANGFSYGEIVFRDGQFVNTYTGKSFSTKNITNRLMFVKTGYVSYGYETGEKISINGGSTLNEIAIGIFDIYEAKLKPQFIEDASSSGHESSNIQTNNTNSNEPKIPTITRVSTENYISGKNITVKIYTKMVKKGNANYALNYNIKNNYESVTIYAPGINVTMGNSNVKVGNGNISIGFNQSNYIIDINIPLQESASGGVTIYFDKQAANNVVRTGLAASAYFFPQMRLVRVGL